MNLARLSLGDQGLEALKGQGSLQELIVDKTVMESDVSPVLQSLRQLQRLQIAGGSSSIKGKLRALRTALPYCQIP